MLLLFEESRRVTLASTAGVTPLTEPYVRIPLYGSWETLSLRHVVIETPTNSLQFQVAGAPLLQRTCQYGEGFPGSRAYL